MEGKELIAALNKAVTNDRKSTLRKTSHSIFPDASVTLDSWRFQDWAYKQRDLITYARGIFTDDSRIVVRGYDKFHNIGETPMTKWEWLKEHTTGPYECTVKENGCIVFIAGYQGNLIVTSKHSTGYRDDLNKNHALQAYEFVKKHLAKTGKTEADLANELEALGLTAVGEYCDDNFEEHVLEYRPEESGIYLTGLNRNTNAFVTRPFGEIQAFASKYGFIVTDFHQVETLSEMQEFASACAETGSWKNRDIEGFVVRCKLKDDGRDFFFKYKFEEPYLMYRQWREVTKSYLKDPSKTPYMNARHIKSCQLYMEFLTRYYPAHPEIHDQVLLHGKGIIELRNKFLGMQSLSEMELVNLGLENLQVKYVIVPVATIGCGKTTVAVALQHLYGWGHVQNDDIPSGKKKKEKFVEAAVKALETCDVVIFDRNNHQIHEREQMFTDMNHAVLSKGWRLKYICLNFLPNGPGPEDWKVTTERTYKRGDNHPMITGMSKGRVTGIMKGFVGRFQRVDPSKAPDNEFDSIIDLKVVENGSRANVFRIIMYLNEHYNGQIELPNTGNIDEAMEAAYNYKANVPPVPPQQLKKEIKYFAVHVDAQLLHPLVSQLPPGYTVCKEMHVTLAHGKSHSAEFKQFLRRFQDKVSVPYTGQQIVGMGHPVKMRVTRFCYNNRIAAFEVDLLDEMSANAVAHITYAMKEGVYGVEANEMLKGEHERVEVTGEVEGELSAYT